MIADIFNFVILHFFAIAKISIGICVTRYILLDFALLLSVSIVLLISL